VPQTSKLEQEILLPNSHMFVIYDYISISLSKVPGLYSGDPVRSLTGTRTVLIETFPYPSPMQIPEYYL